MQHEYSSAQVWRRLAALVYDSFIIIAISFLYGAIMTAIAVNSGSSNEEFRPMFEGPLFPLGWVLIVLIFYCYFWKRFGQTLGMKTWNIKLVNSSFQSPSWNQCLLRAAVAAPCVLVLGIGYWWSFFLENNDCLHDKLSDTRVIKFK